MTRPDPLEAAYAYYILHPSAWVEDKIHIGMARYRSAADLDAFLGALPPDRHQWARRQRDRLRLDATRSYQADALDAMATPGRYAFRWANGTAKTCTAALFVLWFFDCFPGAKVVTTAGTWTQLKDQLWLEIPLWVERAREPIMATGHMAKTQIQAAPDWAVLSRAADRADTFEGVHGEYLLLLIDEAKAVKPEIFDAARRILRGNEGGQFWFVCLSSPGSPSGPFYDMCVGRQADRWTVFHLSAYESERIPLSQIDEDAVELGEESPLFQAMDLGEFPTEGEDTVIPLSWAEAAVGRVVNTEGERTLGVDVARFGDDATALVSLQGRRATVEATYRGKDTVWTTGEILARHRAARFARVAVDDGGVGGAVTDQLRATEGIAVVPVNFGATDRVRHPERFANNKAEMYWMLRAELEAGFKDPASPDVGLSLPDDRLLVHQLTMQRYGFDTRQRYTVEGHKATKTRGEPSPDRADALALANFVRRADAGQEHRQVGQANIGARERRGLAASILREEW